MVSEDQIRAAGALIVGLPPIGLILWRMTAAFNQNFDVTGPLAGAWELLIAGGFVAAVLLAFLETFETALTAGGLR